MLQYIIYLIIYYNNICNDDVVDYLKVDVDTVAAFGQQNDTNLAQEL